MKPADSNIKMEHRKTEAALRESEELYRALIETTATGYVIIDKEGRVLDANPEYVRLSGHRELNEIRDRSVIEWTADYEKEKNTKAIKKCFREGFVRNLEIDYADRDGHVTPIEINATVIKTGETVRILSLCRDISERKQTQEVLERAKHEFEVIYQGMVDGILIADQETHKFVRANPAACVMFGYTEAEFLTKGVGDIHPTEHLSMVVGHFVAQAEGREVIAESLPCLHKNGTVFYADIGANSIVYNNRPCQVGFFRDVTKRKQAEEALARNMVQLADMNRRLQENQIQLIQSEKMASFGQLAAGVAHEINNPVGFVMSNLGALQGYVAIFKKLLDFYDQLVVALHAGNIPQQETLLREIEKIRSEEELSFILKDVDELLKESYNGAERVKDIVQNLTRFVRLDEAKMKEADINDGIEVTLKVIGNELKYKCQVHKKLEPLPPLLCYPSQLNQVFLNLLVNAAQAISEKGDIFIETRATDKEIIIRIADTGRGIAPEHIPKLFTPFFTTKPAGKGTGLGLSISQGIIQKHHGFIHAESELGKGATFTIHLPVSEVNPE
jgi:PAS domain S-box-containing protein